MGTWIPPWRAGHPARRVGRFGSAFTDEVEKSLTFGRVYFIFAAPQQHQMIHQLRHTAEMFARQLRDRKVDVVIVGPENDRRLRKDPMGEDGGCMDPVTRLRTAPVPREVASAPDPKLARRLKIGVLAEGPMGDIAEASRYMVRLHGVELLRQEKYGLDEKFPKPCGKG